MIPLIKRVAGRRAEADPAWMADAVPVPDIDARSPDAGAILEAEEFDLPWVLALVTFDDLLNSGCYYWYLRARDANPGIFSPPLRSTTAEERAVVTAWVEEDPKLQRAPPLFLFGRDAGLHLLDGSLRLIEAKSRGAQEVYILVGDIRPRERRTKLAGVKWNL